ncbi:S49 family peptidase [Oleidesulfovibrio alaskensis]|uniref:S49 family peptidase n=1 Tax=Oleidesulfovibrio alaskensis TaxID=58180 RepID=UPI001A524802|nr:S49 family peptidase [Oleidesulfovibrio alaskensis]MBL3582615.1 S49 family peptidase [Oleidesulfovibrio alaskensis]
MHSLFSEQLWAIQPDALSRFFALLRMNPVRPEESLSDSSSFGTVHNSFGPECNGLDLFQSHGCTQVNAQSVAGMYEEEERPYELHDGVAVINVHGILTARGASFRGYRFTTGMQDELRPAIDAAIADSAVHALLLDVNSPGGTVAGTKELADHIASLRAVTDKPLAAYANGLMASAAYWLAAATGRVLAPATATVGSIGVVAVYRDSSRYNEKAGVQYNYLTSGQFKAAGNPDTPLSDRDRAYLQGLLNTQYRHFTDGVSAGMGLNATELEIWADGKMFVASDAPSGLVTSIVADREEAIATLAKEIRMDRHILATQHPELLASIEREAAEKAVAAMRAAHEEEAGKADAAAEARRAASREACFAAVKAVAGDETAERVKALLEQNLSAAQIEAVAALMPRAAQVPPQAATQEQTTEQRILDGLQSAHAKPLNGAPSRPGDETPAQFGKRMAQLV